jgi:hypothetical protein
MSQDWYVESGGQVDGPLSARELRDRAAGGRLTPTDKVSQDRKTWVRAAKIKGLKFPEQPEKPAKLVAPTATPVAAQSLVETVEAPVASVPGYELLGILGKGACGVVFRARQVKLDRVVALKMVLSDKKPAPAALARFEKEARSLAKLKHPNIVGVHDCGHHDGQAYFAMELLDGKDLAHRIESTGQLDERTAWHIARQTAAALAHAADAGVYHRDVKPANLVLVPPPTGYPLPPGVPLVKVTDFGLALTRQSGEESDPRLTAAGVVLGTPAYMPPEQFAGSDIDHRADIYALGATVYHALSGTIPFEGTTIWEVMLRKAEITPRLGAPVSRESADLVEAMMAEKPQHRVGSYRELFERIDALPCMAPFSGTHAVVPQEKPAADPAPLAATVAPAPATRDRRKLYLLAALGVLVLAGAAAVVAMNLGGNKPTDPPPVTARPAGFTAHDQEFLFNGQSLFEWSFGGGTGWEIDKDEEGAPVITGQGVARRPFRSLKNYRVILGLDLHKAASASVVVATADGPPESARQWVVRVTQAGGAVLGTRDGERGAFGPLDAAVPHPTPQELEKKPPYLEVRYERAGGKFRAWYNSQPLGEFDDDGKLKSAEVRVHAEGGAVRIDTALIEELVERK